MLTVLTERTKLKTSEKKKQKSQLFQILGQLFHRHSQIDTTIQAADVAGIKKHTACENYRKYREGKKKKRHKPEV